MSDATVFQTGRPRKDGVAPMTVKGFPNDIRVLMQQCARRQGLTMAQWLARAVQTQAQLETTGDPVQPPGSPAPPARPREGALGPADLMTLAQAASLAAAASGRPLSKRTAGRIYSLVDQQARTAQQIMLPAKAIKPPARPGVINGVVDG